MSEKHVKAKSIVDSALIIAAISGFCYAVGYIIDTRHADMVDLPQFLMPETKLEPTMLVGGLHLLIVFCLGLFVAGIVMDKSVNRDGTDRPWKKRFLERYYKHTRYYQTGGVLVLLGIIVITARFPYLPRSVMLNTRNTPDVLQVKVKNGPEIKQEEHYQLVSRSAGWTVMRKKDGTKMLVLKEDTIESMQLAPAK